MQDPGPGSDLLEKEPVHPWAVKVLGGVTLWIGVAFVALLLWMVYRAFVAAVALFLSRGRIQALLQSAEPLWIDSGSNELAHC
jgi:hypothetical protein